MNFYRLRRVDIDGSFSYSIVRKLSRSVPVTIHCYPNPVIDYVNVRFDHSAGTVFYSAMTLDGKVLQSGKIQADGTDQTVSLNLHSAPKGMYLIRIQPEGGTSAVQTFTVLKQ